MTASAARPLLPLLILGLLPLATVSAQQTCAGVTPAQMPAIPPPYPNIGALCAASHGQKVNLIPPPQQDANDYSLKLRNFIINRQYASAPYNWLHDLTWRLTGEVEGCPLSSNGALSYGVHPAVRIYYSPEVVEWLCHNRQGPLPPGAMIVKEMQSIGNINVDSSSLMWLNSSAYTVGEWTVMVKSANASADGWFWADYVGGTPASNPPVLGPSATTIPGVNITETGPLYPTGNSFTAPNQNSQVFPYSGLGNYCINCHASAVNEATYSTLNNVLAPGERYKYLGPGQPPRENPVSVHERLLAFRNHKPFAERLLAAPKQVNFSTPLLQADPGFLKAFPQLSDRNFDQALKSQFAAETYNHVPSQANPAGKATHEFITADQCLSCHDATANRTPVLPNMVFPIGPDGPNQTQINLSPWAEWSASPMGLAGRDPVFFSQLESETNIFANLHTAPPVEKEQNACVENTCLHCHGVTGQRQFELDNPGTVTRCASLVPTTSSRLFTRDLVNAWPDRDQPNQEYGGLARDGISCTVCHRMSKDGLGQPSTFTGQFKIGPPDQLYGPFKNDIKTKPMEHALGITPSQGDQLLTSDVCATCHAILLPVYDGMKVVNSRYEQTTYLEWLNSDFLDESCQSCHMPDTYHAQKLQYKIANIEDADYPHTENRLPSEDIDLRERSGFRRHTLVGANMFLNQFFQQFPILLGARQKDYMNGNTTAPLLTTQESFLEFTRNETASLKVSKFGVQGSTVSADVTVSNNTGHSFPSGVSFRRAFIEFLILDKAGNPLWASGRTNDQGQILLGLSPTVLPSEYLGGGGGPDPDVCQPEINYQVHHTTITDPGQVQIYEELLQDTQLHFTTSFLHRYQTVKDNRLRPRGWNSAGPYAKETQPEGGCTLQDPAYVSNGHALSGADTVHYQIALPAGIAAQVASVKATLYYQSIPPYFLKQRFDSAKVGPRSDDGQRLYYLTSHLNVAGPQGPDGQPFMTSWKLRIASGTQQFLGN